MNCYRCGAALGEEATCPSCRADMTVYKKIIGTSNAYYNRALECVTIRDLTGAMSNLKKCLRYNKRHTDARNLLGLVMYEMGETVDALGQWVLSKNFQPEDNLASGYLDEVQKNRSQLEAINQTIKKYNQTLTYCEQGSTDMAILQLKKVLGMNPKMVRGHQLLGLLYLQAGNYEQAKKALKKAQKIDTGNPTTLCYMQEAEARIKAKHDADDANKKNKGVIGNSEISIRPMSSFREMTDNNTILNIAIGLVIGVLITCFLVVPGVKKSATNAAQSDVVEANDTLATKNQEIKSLQSQLEKYEAQIESQKNNAQNVDVIITSYQNLIQAYMAYRDGNNTKAGEALANVNVESLDDDYKKLFNQLNQEINGPYMKNLYNSGYQNYKNGDYAKAISDFEQLMLLDEGYQNGYAIYYLAESYRMNNDKANAVKYYEKIIALYPNTKRANNAQKQIDAYAQEAETGENPTEETVDDAAQETGAVPQAQPEEEVQETEETQQNNNTSGNGMNIHIDIPSFN